jgi:hypothetical protein
MAASSLAIIMQGNASVNSTKVDIAIIGRRAGEKHLRSSSSGHQYARVSLCYGPFASRAAGLRGWNTGSSAGQPSRVGLCCS